MSILLTLTIALLITFVGARIATHFKYPPILGQFIASLILVVPFLRNSIFTVESYKVIEAFSELAIIFLLLLSGLKTNVERINQSKQDVISIAIFSFLTPLISGMLAGYMLGFGITASFILGVALSITAEGTNLAILLQLKKLKTKVGGIIISAGMLNDIFGVILLSFILVLAHKSGVDSLALFPIKILAFVGIVWIASKVIPFALHYFEKGKKEVAMFNAVILVALILSILSESLGLSSIVGAFVAGILLQNSFELRRDEKHEEHEMETLLFGFIIPFFFIHIALNLDYRSLIDYPILIFIVFTIAMFGKVVGVLLAKPFSNLKWGQLLLIGWEMNSRGIIELIIANVALSAGLITTPLYSAIVFTAILTTVISPFIIKGILSKHPRIMR